MARFPRATRTRLAPIALIAFVALVLTGCMRVHMDLTVKPDNTVSGTAVMAVSDELIDLMGSDAEGLFDDTGFEGQEGVTVADYAEDGYTGKRYTFSETPLDEFSDADMSLTREGDEFVLSGSLDMSDGADGLPAEMADSLDVRISFTFPGEVTETNGEVSGTTVTWTPVIGEVNEMTARANAEGGSAGIATWLVVVLVVVAVVLVAVVALVIVLATRSKRTPPAPPVAFAAPGGAPLTPSPAPSPAPSPESPAPSPESPAAPADAGTDAQPPAAPPA